MCAPPVHVRLRVCCRKSTFGLDLVLFPLSFLIEGAWRAVVTSFFKARLTEPILSLSLSLFLSLSLATGWEIFALVTFEPTFCLINSPEQTSLEDLWIYKKDTYSHVYEQTGIIGFQFFFFFSLSLSLFFPFFAICDHQYENRRVNSAIVTFVNTYQRTDTPSFAKQIIGRDFFFLFFFFFFSSRACLFFSFPMTIFENCVSPLESSKLDTDLYRWLILKRDILRLLGGRTWIPFLDRIFHGNFLSNFGFI